MNLTGGLDKQNIEDILALSPMQEGILFHYLKDNDNELYFEQLSINLLGIVDYLAFERAWNKLIANNEILRTVFAWKKLEKPVQIILKKIHLSVVQHDLSHISDPTEQKRILASIKEEDRKIPFVLDKGPLLRVTLCKLAKAEYEVILSNHHIIYDGWSSGIILQEFLHLYEELIEGNEEQVLISRKPRFKEYLKWLHTQKKTEQQRFWQEYLADYTEKTEIPLKRTSFKKISKTTEYSGQYLRNLSVKLSEKIANFVKIHKVTAGSFFYTAWALLLQRYNNVNDVIFGTTVSGRPAELLGIEHMVGLFINTVPLRVKVNSNETIQDVILAVNDTIQNRQKFDMTPLFEIQSYSEFTENEPLFDSIVVFENYPLDQMLNKEHAGITIKSYDIFEKTSYPLALEIMPAKSFILKFIYDAQLISEAAIEQLARHLEILLMDMVDNPSKPITALKVLSAEEREMLLYTFNQTETDYPREKSLVELFSEQVQARPEQVALVFQGERITYHELNEQINRLQQVLRVKGVESGSIVGLLVERSVEMIVGIFAVLKAGGAYLPLNPKDPIERIGFLLEDAGVQLLLTQRNLSQSILAQPASNFQDGKISFKGEMVYLDNALLSQQNNVESVATEANLDFTISADELAYVIYTSGTTGKPKGNLTTHRNISRVVKNTNYLEITPTDRLLQLSNYAFDGSTFDIFGALLNGATLVLLSEEQVLDLPRLAKVIEEEKVTIFFVTTALFNMLVDQQLVTLQNVQKILFGGERASIQHVRKAFAALGPNRLIHVYGPTESTVFATYYPLNQLTEDTETLPIGKPLANTQVLILNRDLQLQPLGAIGELCIAGDGLARGYLQRRDLTAEKFIMHPYFSGEKLYRTGDLAKMLPDGNIEFVGRIDQQVKLRGFRIELAEIETRLIAHPLVQEALVTIQEDQTGYKYLCAYLVPLEKVTQLNAVESSSSLNTDMITGESKISSANLQKYLRKFLPEYMIPTYFVILHQMPLTANGKINYKVLPKPEGIDLEVQYVAPTNNIEEKLVQIWSDVLGVQKPGIRDNFFRLGGHSLKATTLMSKILKEFEVEVSLREIFAQPTIQGLAELIAAKEQAKLVMLEPVREQEYYAVSSAQKRLYILYQMQPNSLSYNIPYAWTIEGELDLPRFKQAMCKLVQRHEAFRTFFVIVDGEPMQQIHPEVEFAITYLESTTKRVDQLLQEFIKPFNLAEAPLFRVELHRLESGKYLFLADMHHIISDGASMRVLLRDFQELYEGKTLPELRLQYKDYSAWQNQFLQSPAILQEEKYWLEELAHELPLLNFPTDYPRPVEWSYAGDSVAFSINTELVAGLRRIAEQYNASLYMVLLAAYNLLLTKYTRQMSLVSGMPVIGRTHPDLENIIGMFVNTLILKIEMKNEDKFSDLLSHVKAKVLHAYESQNYPLEKLIKNLDYKWDRSRNPLFDTLFSLQDSNDLQLQLSGLNVTSLPFTNQISKVDFSFEGFAQGEQIDFTLAYSTKLFKRDSMVRLDEHFVNLLQSIMQAPEAKISDLEIISDKERDLILNVFNATEVPFANDQTLQQQFEKQVEEHPEHIAICFGELKLTYQELNSRTNQLARLLREKGISRGDRVALLFERSIERIIAIIGVLKSGATYVPIDPENPVERIKYILSDSEAKVLLSLQEVLTHKELIDFAGKCLCLDEVEYPSDDSNLEILNNTSDIVVLIYTSGTTGQPKGTLITHTNINRVVQKNNCLEIYPEDRLLLITNYVFDVSLFDIFGTLTNGAALVLITEEQLLNMDVLVQIIEEEQITISSIPTSIFNMLADNRVIAFQKMRLIFTGGDRASVPHIRKVLAEVGPGKLVNSYGPTESTVMTSFYYVNELGEDAQSVFIGQPLSNTQVYIVDAGMKLQPIGVQGELCIGGKGLASGYVNQPELTAEKFILNPFKPGERLYRSGDLAKWLPDGQIEFIGRIDQQVKLRGYRIELNEIEARLLNHPLIKQTVVVLKTEQQYLCAYLVAEKEVSALELRQYLAETLPSYMIPAYFVFLSELPLTSNGKINHKALPEPLATQGRIVEYVALVTECEKQLAILWTEVLGVKEVGRTDDFFLLGGHSLKASSLALQIMQKFGVEISLREIISHSTLTELADLIEKNMQAEMNADKAENDLSQSRVEQSLVECAGTIGGNRMEISNELNESLKVGHPEYYPISSAERRMFILYQLESDSLNYNMPLVLKAKGYVVWERFKEVFNVLIERHEAFRTSFKLLDGEPVQQVHQKVDFILPYLKATNEDEFKDILHRFIRPFDLKEAPLMRACFIEYNGENYFVIDMHHIISDGFSMSILVREFEKLYAGQTLPELKAQYKDYRQWQNAFLQSDQFKKEEEFWHSIYAEEAPILNLPLDYPRGAERSYVGDVISFTVDSEMMVNLRKFSMTHRVTLYMTLFAVYNLLLEKYSGQDDIVVGTPIAGRSHSAFQGVIGMFVNTLAIRTRISAEESFSTYLQRVKELLLQAFGNQNYPFEMLIDKLDLANDITRNPLFDVFFSLQSADDLVSDFSHMSFETVPFKSGVAKFDVSLDGTILGQKIDFQLEYCSKLFKREKMEQFARHFLNLLKNVLVAPEQKLKEIELLSPEEKQQIVYNFNQLTIEYSKEQLLHQLFEAQLQRAGERIALRFKEQVMTYEELNRKANQLARHLRKAGVGPEKIVALLFEPSMERIIAMLAVLKAGGAYLPIDTENPAERVNLIFADSKPVILLTMGNLAPKFNFTGEVIDLTDESIFSGEASDLPVLTSPDNLAYIIYTSGSTGKPKGVMIEHRNVVAYACSFAHEFKFTQDDSVMHVASYAFDASVDEIYHILFVGGSVVIAEKEEVLDVRLLAKLIEKNRVTVFSSTPLLLNELNKLAPLHTVHTFLSGGDLLKPEYISNLRRYAMVYNVYGPTETTVCATFYKCSDKELHSVPIGKPFANYSLYLFNKAGQPVPIGVEGEICISGVGVARGYLNQPMLTADKFVTDPFNVGRRMYRTGDLGRWLPDGSIEFLGRVDYQIKIRGYRIEPGEIEHALSLHPCVYDAIVIERKDALRQSYLCAYVVLKKDVATQVAQKETDISVADLKNFLTEVLPEYMVPARFVIIDEIPYTSTGKVERKRLPEPEEDERSVDYLAPANAIEEKLAMIWSELLGVSRVSRKDNFFALGGHSLKATALVLQIYQIFHVEIPLRHIFNAATLEELAELIVNTSKSNYHAITPVEKRDYYPVSSAQKRQFILNQYEGIQTTYNLPGMFIIEGALNRTHFTETIQKLVERHDAFRTSFEMVNGEIIQKIHTDVQLDISYREVEEGELEKVARDFIQSFDLSKAPLVRVGLFKFAEKHCLIFDMHHIISDAVSLNILIYDFAALYQGEELEPLTLQYKDFAVWQNEFFHSEVLAKQERYWLELFSGELPILNLPSDYARPMVQSFEGDHLQFALERDLVEDLRGLMQLQGVTLYMALLATYSILLAKYSAQEDIVVGSPIAGRDYPGLEKILGMFVNTLAMRNYPTGDKTFVEYLAEVKENALQAYEHQDYPLELLIERMNVQRDLSRNPLFDTVLVVQNADAGEMSIPELIFSSFQVENKVSRFDLTWMVEETDTLYFNVEYSTKLFRRETVEQMSKHFINILREVTANPYLLVKDIDMLSADEKTQLLYTFNQGFTEYPREKTVQQLFEEQVLRTPERIALKYGNECMTYQELNAKANRLARVLRAKGIGRDQLVGMLIQRSTDMLVAILAIVKAGGAYLPMDPAYPLDRIEYMLIDSATKVLITDQHEIPSAFTGEVLNLQDEDLYRVPAKSLACGQVTDRSVQTSNDDSNIASFCGLEQIEEFMNDELDFAVAVATEENVVELTAAESACADDDFVLITDESNLENFNSPEDLLYIIYTSGSTGKPKGVMIEHHNLVRLMFNDQFQFDFTENDVWTLFHSYCFDFSVWEMYGALLYGGTLVIVPKLTAQNPGEFRKLLRDEQVTVLNQTPTAFYKLSEEEMQADDADLEVRYIIYGGEALKPMKLKEWHTKYPKTQLINMYGITETTVHVTFKEITDVEISAGISNIGKPIPTLTTYILNRDLKLVPLGVPGEICVGGEGLARGYLNRSELTAEKFIQHPYIHGERLYRSGDLGRILISGEMEYLGRIDHQVKIRGFRIELGEIESKLLQHEAVSEAIVLDYKDVEGQSYLAAYLVTEREISVTELRKFLKTSLPDYMVPAYFMRLEQLPLTSNGKLDRRALPVPEGQMSGRAYVSPTTDTEAKLALIWQDVLNVEQVGRDDDFFELGGHSLKATTLVQKLKKELNVELSLKEVFKAPVLKDLAVIIDRAQRSIYTSLEPVAEREYYPVSAVQKRIYIYHEIKGANTVYNIPDALIIEGELDIEQFQAAVQQVVNRHEAFRTSFKKVGNEVVQVISPQVDFRISKINLLENDQENISDSALEKCINDFVQPFDLSQAPLLRVGYAQLGKKHLVIFDMHHSIADGTSMGILIGDFLKAYIGEELPPLKVQYKDFAIWQNNFFASDAITSQEEYWLSMFADGVPELNLPLDYQRPETLTTEGDTVQFNLAETYVLMLEQLAQKHNGTLFMVLLAAYNILLAKYSGQDQIVVGTPIAGRTHADLAEIIGMFVNTLALKTNPAGEKTFLEYFAEVRDITLKAYENQDYQFEMLIDKLGLHLAQNRTPLFDVMLVLQNMGRSKLENDTLTVKPYSLETKTAKFDLSLYVIEENGLSFTLDYRVSLFMRETVELFANRLVQLLSEIAESPEKKISELCSAMADESIADLSAFMDDLEDEF